MFERPKISDLERRAKLATVPALRRMAQAGRAEASVAWMLLHEAGLLLKVFRGGKPSRSLASLVSPDVFLFEGAMLLFAVSQGFLGMTEHVFPLGVLEALGLSFERYAGFSGELPSIPGVSSVGVVMMGRSWMYGPSDPERCAQWLAGILMASLGRNVPLDGEGLDAVGNIWRAIPTFPRGSDAWYLHQSSLAFIQATSSTVGVLVQACRSLNRKSA